MGNTLDMAAFNRLTEAMGALPKMPPMTIVPHHAMMPGKAWEVDEDDHLYAFVHPSDLAALPTAPSASAIGFGGIPVRAFDAEMRAVLMRAIAKLAAANPLPLKERPCSTSSAAAASAPERSKPEKSSATVVNAT